MSGSSYIADIFTYQQFISVVLRQPFTSKILPESGGESRILPSGSQVHIWRSGLSVGETVDLEWQDINIMARYPAGLHGQGRPGPDRAAAPGPVRQLVGILWSTGLRCRVDPEDGPAAPAGWHRACRPG